ncbi:MAG: hypothetical protein GF320_01985, partial [Armatimonadia bacterium]|nr:hypothetical protein [Armatimonadia bacterium]
MLPAIAIALSLSSGLVGGPILEDILNPVVRDQGTTGLDTEDPLTVEAGSSIGQTFVTGDNVIELYRVMIWQAFWHETWDADERLVLTLWDSPEKNYSRGRDVVPYERRMWESALTMFVLEAPVEPSTEYYLELTVEREPLRPAEVPTEWILAGERPGAAGGDGVVGGIGRTEDGYAAGQAYAGGEPTDRGMWFETHVRRDVDADDLYAEAFGRLNLDYPAFADVSAAVETRDWDRACDALIEHFESRPELFPPPEERVSLDPTFDTTEADLAAAHRVLLEDGNTVDLGPRFSHHSLWPERGGVGLTRSGLRKPLAAGYSHTGHEKYARAWNELLRSFFVNHPSPLRAGAFQPDETIPAALPPGLAGGSMWSGLAIGARMAHGFWYYGVFMDSPSFTRDVRAGFILNLGEMADVLERMEGAGNWETQMATGLMEFGITYPEFARASRWIEQGFGTLVDNALSTVYPDGCLHEPAIGYHMMCMRRYAKVMRVAAEMDLELPPELPDLTERMYEYVMYSTLPDGNLPIWGDGNPPMDCPDLVDDAALFGRDDFLFVGTGGERGTEPTVTDKAFPDGGYYFMRTDWSPDAHYMAVRCGPRGSHGHDDALEVLVASHGELRLYDPGIFNYGTPEARELRRTASHGTVTIDGANTRSAHPLAWMPGEDLVYFAGESDGTEGVEGVVHQRRVIFAKPTVDGPAAWVVFDDILGEAEHELVSRYRFVPGDVEVDADARTVVSADDGGNLLIRTLEDGVGADVVDRIAVHPGGEFGEAPAAEFALTTDLPAAFTTILLPFDEPAPPEIRSQLLQPTSGTGRAAWLEMGDQAILV